ncbi:AAA family ATPase [Myxococcus stipitatus]|uniref:AAA family ATPase n=1 Tax=Myxococcus stipitatus TaxID=83455 RepID=UPI0030D3B0BA
MTAQLHVITGGPGSGKSSLIQALTAEGLRSMPEAGRAIIQQQVETGGDALPWADRLAFAEQMFRWELRTHREAREQRGPVILDRGLPDVIGYLRVCGLPVPPYLWKAAKLFRYHRRVFIAPHWPEIYAQDTERKQDLTEAEATCRAMQEVYTSLGYELLPLPLVSIPERVRFVRSHLEHATPRSS